MILTATDRLILKNRDKSLKEISKITDTSVYYISSRLKQLKMIIIPEIIDASIWLKNEKIITTKGIIDIHEKKRGPKRSR